LPTTINEENKVNINVIKIILHQPKLSQFSWIVLQLKAVNINIFSMVAKELYFLKLRPTNIKRIKEIYIQKI
jgi:hypothetical protein